MPTDKKDNKNTENVKTSPKEKTTSQESPTSQKSQATKWIFFFLMMAGLGLLGQFFYEKNEPATAHLEMQSQSQFENHFVSRDLYEMYRKGQIPKHFFNLKSIKWSYYDNELKTQIPEEVLPFKATNSGAYNLEIDAFSSSKKTSKIAVLQMNLIEVKTGNKVWELSRNYEIPNTK